MKPLLLLLAPGAACLLGSRAPLDAIASPFTATCPPSFPSDALHVAPAQGEWTAAAGTPAPLASIGLFNGPTVQGASLKPAQANKTLVTWHLEPPYPQGLWLQCAYAGGSLTLARPLPDTPSTCTARYGKAQVSQPRAIAFECK